MRRAGVAESRTCFRVDPIRLRQSAASSGIGWGRCLDGTLEGRPRIDGRDTKMVRPITIRTGVLPRTHGSALFTRGET